MTNQYYATHGTVQEIAFLRHLGVWSDRLDPVPTLRLILLRKYLQAAEKRTVWENIDRYEVFSYLQDAILEIENRMYVIPQEAQ
jgi:hypothetical protein